MKMMKTFSSSSPIIDLSHNIPLSQSKSRATVPLNRFHTGEGKLPD